MSYRNQMIKEFANGKFGKKTYLDLTRRKPTTKTNITVKKQQAKAKAEDTPKPKDSLVRGTISGTANADQRKDSSTRGTLYGSVTTDPSKDSSARGTKIKKTSDTIDTIKKINRDKNSPTNTKDESNSDSDELYSPIKEEYGNENLQSMNTMDDNKGITVLENYLADIVEEMDNLSAAQNNIIDAISQLSKEIEGLKTLIQKD